jgi:twitching motility protein PilT
LETTYLRGEKITFDHLFGTQRFQVLVCKTNLGTRIVIGRSPGSPTVSAPANSTERIQALVVKLLNLGGSDLYLNAGEVPILRLDGRLEVLEEVGPTQPKDLLEYVQAVAPPPIQEAFKSGEDAEFSLGDPTHFHRMRISLFHDAAGPSVAIRVIPKSIPDAPTLGLNDTIQRLAHLNRGLVLLTGPMGSGRSTTMACLLEIANHARKDFIITIQDSTEFEFPSGTCVIRQREVGRSLQRQHQAIRSALRQAPDILALGELRDAESIDLALQAAHSGRLVLATLPTTSVVDTLYYLVDAFPVESQARVRNRLADCLKAVVGHTLLRRTQGGRAAALETLFNNPGISELIREGKFEQVPGSMKGGHYGQVSHNDALVQLIHGRKVEPMEAYLKCQDRESFIAACKKADIDFDPRGAGHATQI